MKQLGISFGYIFLLFSFDSTGGVTLILAREIPNPRLLVTALMSLIGYLSGPDEPNLPVRKRRINIVPSPCHFHGLHMFSY